MGDEGRSRRASADPGPLDTTWLSAVSEGASQDAGVPGTFLGDYLPLLADAATVGRVS